MTIHIYQILTIGGTVLWKEEDSHDLHRDILHPNDIYLDGEPIHWKNAYLCKVDSIKTNIHDFYQWTEVSRNSELFCWRTFYTFSDKSGINHGWLAMPQQERLEPYGCQDVLDGICQHDEQRH